MNLESRAARQMTKVEFAGFLNELADSLVEDPQKWENVDLVEFLRAWSAWVEDMDGYFENRSEPVPQEPSWQLMAQMLLAARIYE